jgi:hypothetical protein
VADHFLARAADEFQGAGVAVDYGRAVHDDDGVLRGGEERAVHRLAGGEGLLRLLAGGYVLEDAQHPLRTAVGAGFEDAAVVQVDIVPALVAQAVVHVELLARLAGHGQPRQYSLLVIRVQQALPYVYWPVQVWRS